MAIPFSEGVASMIRDIHPYSQKQGRKWYPKRWDPETGKQGGNESLHQWYRRCVDDYFDGQPIQCAIERNFAAFVSIRWVEDTRLVFVSAQAIIVRNKSLESYYASGSDQVHYFRLDYFGARIGAMFKEHCPHVHIAQDGAPWLPCDSTSSGNIIIDFFDFIYRNFYHDKWLDWAQKVWTPYAVERNIKEDPFPVIVKAFNAHQIPSLLGVYKNSLLMMKHSWRENNDNLLPLFVDNETCRLLSYTG